MTDSAATLSALANVVFLLRDKTDAQEEQRAAFRAFAQGLGGRDLSVTLTERGFLVGADEVPFGSVAIDALHGQLAAIGVGGFRLPAGLMMPALLSLVRAVSVPPGTYGSFDHLMARLDAAGSGRFKSLRSIRSSRSSRDPIPTQRTTRARSKSWGPMH